MKICGYSYRKYMRMINSFHGYPAPGLIIGGFMVDLALRNLPENALFQAVCESSVCIPDAVQLLTPYTIGNGRLSIVNSGRFAITLYDKYNGAGIRIFLDSEKLKNWPVIEEWFSKKKKKDEQDSDLLRTQIRKAGQGILSIQRVQVDIEKVRRKKIGQVGVCPVCHEVYPVKDGDSCKNCQGDTYYTKL